MNSSSVLSQKTLPWANELIGNSKFYIHAYGGALVALSEILGLTPTEVNTRLKEVDGFSKQLDDTFVYIDWSKISLAFPQWSAQFHSPYDNTAVKAALSKDLSVIVQVDGRAIGIPYHYVRYMGSSLLHDPLDGAVRSTSLYPQVLSFIVLSPVVVATPPPISEVPEVVPQKSEVEEAVTPDPKESPAAHLDTKAGVIKHVKKLKRELREIEKLLKL